LINFSVALPALSLAVVGLGKPTGS